VARRFRLRDSFAACVASRVRAHRLPALAAESAFFVALAVFPTLLTVVALLRAAGPVLGDRADAAAVSGMTRLLRVVLTTRGSAAADAAQTLLDSSSSGLLTAGTIAALALLVRALRSVLHALGVIAGRRPRSWYVALLLAAVLLLLAASVTAAAVQDPLLVSGVPGASLLWRVARWPAVALALLAWAVLLLRIGARTRGRPVRVLLAGALVVTGGWFAASALFPLYVALIGRFSSGLGALGGGLILMVWLYLLMISLYLGAEVMGALAGSPDSASRARPL
jgi:membrane protein